MKHAILAFLLAFLLAWLSACACAAPGSAEPALQLSGRTLRACAPLAGTALPLCRRGILPGAIGRVVTAAPASFEALDASLSLIVDAERHGWLCLLDGDQVRCTPVEAPAPQNMEIRFWHLPDGYHAVTYTHIPGTPIVLDPGAQVTNAFQRALEAAAVRVQQLLAGAGRNARPGTQARIDGCDAPDESGGCVMDGDPGYDPGTDQGGGGGNPLGDWDNGPGPGTEAPPDPWGDWDNGPGPGTDVPAGPPGADTAPSADPYCDNGPCPGIAIEDAPPMIPTLPHDPATDTADLTPCDAVIPGIISICIHERRPPPPAELAPLPAGPAPWFPQSWCDFASLFCSNGQMQKSAESGKTLAELADDCAFHLRVKLDLCKVDDIIHPNTQRFADCLQAARDEYEACVTRARDLTDNGAHPAP